MMYLAVEQTTREAKFFVNLDGLNKFLAENSNWADHGKVFFSHERDC